MTKKVQNRKAIYIIITILLVLICFAGLLWEFSTRAFQLSEQLSQIQMEEVSSQAVQTVNIKVQGEISYISALALTFADHADLHAEETLTQLASIAADSPFDRIRLTTPDGRSFSAPGNMIDIVERDYFRLAMAGNSGISDTMFSFYNNAPIFTVYAPIIKNGEIVGTIHGARELTTLSDVLNITSFKGTGSFYIFKKNGDLILKSDNDNVFDASYLNLWRFLEKTALEKKSSIEAVQKSIADESSGFFSYTVRGEAYLAYYTPLGINDWSLLHVMPRSSVSFMSASFQHLAVDLIFRALLLLGILGTVSLYFVHRSQKAMMAVNRELCISNERFRIAISHTPSVIFDYNIPNDRLTFEGDLAPPHHLPRVIEKVSFYLVTQNIVAEESADAFQQMFREIRGGASSATAVIKIQTQSNPIWERVMLTSIFDNDRHPLRTIGTIEDITEQVLADLRRQQAEEHRRTLSADALWLYDINITQDIYYKYNPALPPPENPVWMPYSSNVVASCHSNVAEDDRAAFMEIADRNRLMQAFEQNITDLTCEYRALNPDGSCIWLRSNSHLLPDPVTGQLHCYTYVKNIQQRKEHELLLRQQAELDPLTGLYNRQAAERLITDALKNEPCNNRHCFFSIDIDDFKHINDQFGHMGGDQILRMVADECKGLFRSKDIVARMGGDEFIIFLWGAYNLAQIETIANRLCDHIRRLTFQPEGKILCMPLSISVGIAISPQHGETFDTLYRNSDLALYYAKQHGKNRHAVYFQGLSMEVPS